MKNSFVQFKDFLKGIKRDWKVDLKRIKNYKNLLGIYEEMTFSGAKKPSADGFDVNAFIDDLTNIVTLHDFSDFYVGSLDEILSMLVNYSNKYIGAYDNEKAIDFPPFEDIVTLLTGVLSLTDMKVDDITKIFGSTVYFGATHPKKVPDEYKSIVEELAQAFDQYGNFVYSNINMSDALTHLLSLFPKLATLQAGSEFTTEIWFSIMAAAYQEFCSKREMPKVVEEVSDDKNIEYSNRIGEYCRNGKLIKVPEDLTSFVSIMDEENIESTEQRHILQLIKEELKAIRESKLAGFYATMEEEVIEYANKVLDESSNYQGYYYEIKELLGNIRTLEDMYIEALSDDDKEYIIEEKDSLISRLKEILAPDEEKEVINVAFLEDSSGNSYYLEDLESIDKGIRKRANNLLSKINNANKRNFRKVFLNEGVDIELYEVVNPDLHIVFTEIPGNVYMVIGVAPARSGYREIINRVLNKNNKENMMLIASAIKDEETKRNYLLKENAKVAGITESVAR